MCISVPAQIVSIEDDFAEVSVNGALFKAGLQLIEEPRVGEYVLLHAGFVLQKISAEEAEQTLLLWNEMNRSDETEPEP